VHVSKIRDWSGRHWSGRVPGRRARGLLRGLGLRRLAAETFRGFYEDDIMTYAAAVAYQALYALFPFIIVLLALFSFLDRPELFQWLLEHSRRFLPGEASAQVEQVVAEIRGRRQSGLLSVGLLTTLWIASGGVRSAMNALNKAYEVPEGRAIWKRFVLSFGYVLLAGSLVVVATGLMVFGPMASDWGLRQVGAPAGVREAVAWLRIPLAIAGAVAGVFLVYLAMPNVKQRVALVVPGAVFSVVLWGLVSLGFRWYVEHLGQFSVTYGSVGAVIVLLTYFYLSSLILLTGAELNAAIQRARPQEGDACPKELPDDAQEPAKEQVA
jgi:membrane protein